MRFRGRLFRSDAFLAIILSNSLKEMLSFFSARFWHRECNLIQLSRYDRTITYLQDSDTVDRLINPVVYSTRKEPYITSSLFTVTVLVKRLNYPLVPFSSFFFFFTSTCTIFTRIRKKECNVVIAHETQQTDRIVRFKLSRVLSCWIIVDLCRQLRILIIFKFYYVPLIL